MKKAGRINGGFASPFLPEYGKRKLLGYADSFRDLAKTFTYNEGKDEKSVNKKEEDRQSGLWRRRLLENRELLADHLNEMAQIMTEVARETYHMRPLREKEEKRILRLCKENGILVREIYRMEDREGSLKISMSARAADKKSFTIEEVADFMSVLFDKRLLPERSCAFYLTQEYETVFLEEEAAFSVLTGAAKATRETETVSGDTYSFLERGNGNLIMALSDGMGSGEKAMQDSEQVIDLLEKFLEAGFSKDMAVEMINGSLIARAEEENMSTLDLCDINLYTGMCEFMKIGSSYTYIKRDDRVEQISSDNLPLGIFHKMDVDRKKRQLLDGDYVIIISDGVIDGIGGTESMWEAVSRITMQNPKEIANYILRLVLQKTGGRIPDDMTVLVAGIWENKKTLF